MHSMKLLKKIVSILYLAPNAPPPPTIVSASFATNVALNDEYPLKDKG